MNNTNDYSKYPTPEELQKVRNWECMNRGHVFDMVLTYGKETPAIIVCSNCSKSWKVVET